MASLVSLVAVLSVDVTRVLVSLGHGLGFDSDLASVTADGVGRFTTTLAPASSATATPGLPYPPLAVTGCTGIGVPIVITTRYAHGISSRGIGGMSCIISGVTGNTAANNVSTDPLDRTVGLNQGVLAVPVPGQPNQLALYGQDSNPESATVGQLIALIGNGAWAGGGTVVPALTDGSILMGRDTVREQSGPPRIVMIPTGSKFGPRTGGSPNPRLRTAERRAQISQRSIRTAMTSWEVQCWGQATPPDPARDIDATWALPLALIDSSHLLFGSDREPVAGEWDDEKKRATQQNKAGHLFTFGMTINVPCLDNALPFIPAGSSFGVIVQTPTPEVGATITVPIN